MEQMIEGFNIVGIELRTSNEGGRAFQDIPLFWGKFMSDNISEQIPDKASDDIYAAYTNFDNSGKNNEGMYSLIIGCQVNQINSLPDGLVSVRVPRSKYRIFPVLDGKPDSVGTTWQTIWDIPKQEKRHWAYICEFEHYKSSGEIDIYIGLS